MRSSKSGRRGERGVTLVLMALMLFLAIGMSALAIDYGMIKAAKAEAQRAMDSAALAGASAFIIPDPLIDKSPIAEARARDFAKKHQVHRVQVTDPEVAIDVDLVNQELTATYTGGGIPLWFASIFGSPTMAIRALARAHVAETSNAACVMPIAIPDIWKNNDIDGVGTGHPTPEELVEDDLWDFLDRNGNGVLDEPSGPDTERELWEFDPGADEYDQDDYGYGSTYRNGLGGTNPFLNKTNDYGRQLTLMTISSKDGTTSSNYYAWGLSSGDANSGAVLSAKITEESCEVVTVGGAGYPAVAGNGATAGQISPAWDTRIGYDPGAYWNDMTNTVEGSDFDDGDDDGLVDSPRVVIVALYNPELEMLAPSDNSLVFNNFAKVFLDKRPPGCSGASCKAAITGRFLGFVGGPGGGPGVTGSLIKTLELIK